MNQPMRLRWMLGGATGLATINRWLATALFVLLTAVVALQVLTRFVLHVPVIWSEEVARFLFFWVVLLGAAMSVKDRRHFVIDATGGRAPADGRGSRLLFDLFPDLCVLGFSILLFVEGWMYADVGRFRIGTNSRINMSLVYAAIPVFAALSVVYAASNLLLDWHAFAERRRAAARAPNAAD